MLTATAQSSNRDLAVEKKDKAIQLMDNGRIEEAIALLQEAKKLDPEDPVYDYETGYAKYLAKDYEGVISIMKKLVKHKHAAPYMFQLLGNSYDMAGQPKKAIETYEKGLQSFPKAGNLYLELGVMQLKENNADKATGYFEAGVQADPKHSSNYFWLGKLYCNSDSPVWGMLYGEIFMNLERGSARTEEMSQLLYLTYKSRIQFSDTGLTVKFSHNNTILLDPSKSSDPAYMLKKLQPFGTTVYETLLGIAAAPEKHISLASLHNIRERFVQAYFQQGHDERFPNLLFDYQQQLRQGGHFEAYNYWLMSKGDEEAWKLWVDAHPTQWEDFIRWFKENPLQVTEENKFYRRQYL